MNDLAVIRRVAGRVRARLEREAAAHGNPADLEGYCARGAVFCYRRLRRRMHTRLYAAKDTVHFFVVAGGFLVDVTATQFNTDRYGNRWKTELPAVYVEPLASVPQTQWWYPRGVWSYRDVMAFSEPWDERAPEGATAFLERLERLEQRERARPAKRNLWDDVLAPLI